MPRVALILVMLVVGCGPSAEVESLKRDYVAADAAADRARQRYAQAEAAVVMHSGSDEALQSKRLTSELANQSYEAASAERRRIRNKLLSLGVKPSELK